MTVSKDDYIPIFHDVYRGNRNDSPVFIENIEKLVQRLDELNLAKKDHTIVFDRGCNSKKNLKYIEDVLGLFYVGALSPCHHKQLIEDADSNYTQVKVSKSTLCVYRDKREIWGQERTVLVFVSDKLKSGQVKEVYQIIEKCKQQLEELQISLNNPRGKKYTRKALIEKIEMIIGHRKIKDVFSFSLNKKRNQPYQITYEINEEQLEAIENSLGFRIIMTNRHEWSSEDIIKAYYGQSIVENAFKNLKNPFHISLRPNFHWSDQKIKIHAFSCVMAYTLTMLLWKTAKEKSEYNGSLDNLLDTLNNIRLATILTPGKKKVSATYQLEEMDAEETKLFESLDCCNIHERKLKIDGLSIYK